MTIEHWESRYAGLHDDKPSWYQAVPATSLRLIKQYGKPKDRVIDIGGGDSRLVDELVAGGFSDVTVVDISTSALESARARLGSTAPVNWIACDIRDVKLEGPFSIWHDRAAYHFLTDPRDIRNYWAKAQEAVPVGGHVILATFADDGPETCSGLPVQRYDEPGMAKAMGGAWTVVEQFREQHLTPWGSGQSFLWTVARPMP